MLVHSARGAEATITKSAAAVTCMTWVRRLEAYLCVGVERLEGLHSVGVDGA